MYKPPIEDVFYAFPGNAAVINREGKIVITNAKWNQFGHENGAPNTKWPGRSYLDACRNEQFDGTEQQETTGEDDDERYGLRARIGLEQLLLGNRNSFTMEYPCHSPQENRWFLLRARGFTAQNSRWAVISHINISGRRKKEQRLKYLVSHDPLTGLLTKKHFRKRLSSEISRAKRYGTELSVCMLDIDYFKNINDQYGHLTGDDVLQKVGNILTKEVRESDVAGRFGGEEFALAFQEADPDTVESMAERIRTRIENSLFEDDGEEINVTVSIGTSSLTAGDDSPDDLLKRADEALYRAKQTGRNRTVASSSS